MSLDVNEVLTTAEVAQQYQVSERTVERWVERGLAAQKATEEQLWQLLREKRLKGLPPKGVWLIERSGLSHLASIRKPVGYPKGKARSKRV
jgi:hypothetical protein